MSPRFGSIGIVTNKFRPRIGSKPFPPLLPSLSSVPSDIERPPYARIPPIAPVNVPQVQIRKDASFFKKMRKAGEIAAIILDALGRAVTPGISTADLDTFAVGQCTKYKVYPSPLGYRGFPRAICTSVNEVVCHGIPNQTVLNDGDIVKIDVTIYLDGVHADCAATFPVGFSTSADALRLIDATRTAAACAAASCVPNAPLSDIPRVVETVASRFGCVVIPSVCGHGIGENFHEAPRIAHAMRALTKQSAAMKLQAGMSLTVEPALALAECTGVIEVDQNDGWTVRTVDKEISAQFEHTLIVTDRGPQIVTALP